MAGPHAADVQASIAAHGPQTERALREAYEEKAAVEATVEVEEGIATDWADDDYEYAGIQAQPVDVDDEPAAPPPAEWPRSRPRATTGPSTSSCASTCFAGQTIAVRDGITLDDVSTLVADHHGTAGLSIPNVSADISYQYSTPFGDTRGTTPIAWTGDHGFLDKPQDVTGLTAIGARYYDPTLGRFISVDPVMDLTDPQQWAAYNYSNNNPVTWSDPTGMWWEALPVDNRVKTGPVTASPDSADGLLGGPECRYASCDGLTNGGEFEDPYFSNGAGHELQEAVTKARNTRYNDELTPALLAIESAVAQAQAYTGPEWLHTGLDGAGMIPGVGEPFDLVNCLLYGSGGDTTNAAISCGGAAMGIGSAATGGRLIAKTGTDAALGAMPALPKELAGGKADVVIYKGYDDTGKEVYAGITNDLNRRKKQHGDRFDPVKISDELLTRGQARSVEQALIVRAREGGLNYQNKRNEISPKRDFFLDAVVWGETWLQQRGL